MYVERKNKRFTTDARARISGAFEGEALLKDISVTGCCIECTSHAEIEPDAPYVIEIIPESASDIGRFEITVKSRWMRAEGYSYEIGFFVIASPKGRLFQRYVDYLDYRHTHPGK
jgi:hypothetical protein